MSELSRKHHTLPRFYLERFADDRGILTQVRLPGVNSHPVSIAKASVIRDFYSINVGTNEEPELSDFWEKQFAKVEATAATAFRAIVDHETWPPSPHHRAAIAMWAALQHLRSPAIRNQQHGQEAMIIRLQTATNGIKHLRQVMEEGLGRHAEEAELEAEWMDLTKPGGPKIDLGAQHHIQLLRKLIGPTAEMFSGSGWALCRFQRRAVLTSDTPVVLLPHPDAHPMMGIGIGTAGAFLVPLSRRVCLFITQPDAPDIQITGTVALARSFNTLTAENARQSVFHHPAEDPLDGITLPDPLEYEVDDGGVDSWISRDGWRAPYVDPNEEPIFANPPEETDARYEEIPLVNTQRADFKMPDKARSQNNLDHYSWPIPNRVFKNPFAPTAS